MSEKLKAGFASTNAITLISLVITIIILIILAGVGINLSLGENGIFRRAKEARDKYLTASEREQQQLNELYAYLDKDDLPENTPETDAGTRVKLPNNWVTALPNYVSDEDGSIIKESQVASTVYAVSDGKGNTIPVPIGFYYVGGTKDSGVVISDNKKDENKYNGQEDVPSGIKLEEGKLVYTLLGNQFVWIPTTLDSYIKYNWGTNYTTPIYSLDTPTSEYMQIKKYGGFYVGRYEAGLNSTIKESIETRNDNVQNDYNIYAVPQSKAGIVPWNFIDYTHSKVNATNMYDTNYVQSGLMTGTMWDRTITWLADEDRTSSILTSSKWGNYSNTSLKINIGRKAYAYYSAGWKQEKFDEEWLQSTETNNVLKPSVPTEQAYLLTTGASEECKLKNLYDLAGNMWEWTEESAHASIQGTILNDYKVTRGGNCSLYYDVQPVCYRNYDSVSVCKFDISFRIVLYIK